MESEFKLFNTGGDTETLEKNYKQELDVIHDKITNTEDKIKEYEDMVGESLRYGDDEKKDHAVIMLAIAKDVLKKQLGRLDNLLRLEAKKC